MVMTGQSKRLAQPLRWGRRERAAVAAAGALLVAGLVALAVLALASNGRSPAPVAGCIDAATAGYLGANIVHVCGADARTMCSAGTRTADPGSLAAQCQRNGYLYRPADAGR